VIKRNDDKLGIIMNGILLIGIFISCLITNIMGIKKTAPIAYLERTKKNNDVPSSKAIFAEFGTNANAMDETMTKTIPTLSLTFSPKYCISKVWLF
jgi:hypothetical protein